jgi:hypothetical protein
MKAGLLGPSYMQRDLPFDAQRSVNLFPILDQEGKEVGALYGAPGLSLLKTAAASPGRQGFASDNGRAFAVIGAQLMEIQGDGSQASLGSLQESQGNVTMAENGVQLAICDGTYLYILTYATNAFVKVSSPGLATASSVDFIDGYFVISVGPSSGQFQISALYDGTSWAALDFATAESSPDALLRVMNVSGQLWLMGYRTVEIWANTGALNFPFQKISGAAIQSGALSAYACASLDNSAFWVGNDVNGRGIVNKADGLDPTRISTETIERRIQACPDPSSLKMNKYQEEGHTFLIITGGGMETALCYDLATQLWHERAHQNDQGNYELPLQADIFFAFGKQIALDRRNGNIYVQSLDYVSDNGDEMARDRVFTHLNDENKRVTYKNLTVGFEVGLGNQSDPGKDPQCVLSLSKDGGKTWFGNYMRSIGAAGQYLARAVFHRLGQARTMTFRVRVTDQVPVRICGAYFNV